MQATNRSFTVVFRTFGSDIQDVIEEVNMFAEGRHPSYPGVYMDGRDGMVDVRLTAPSATGAFIRCALTRSFVSVSMRKPCFRCCVAVPKDKGRQ